MIACAGLSSDAVSAMAGPRDDLKIIPFRGEYFALDARTAALVNGLVYPVPDPRYPFLGVHLTRDIHDHVHVGPNAVITACSSFSSPSRSKNSMSLGLDPGNPPSM